jgi:hypothetical protein
MAKRCGDSVLADFLIFFHQLLAHPVQVILYLHPQKRKTPTRM